MARRGFISGAHSLAIARCFGATAAPVVPPREHDRIGRALVDVNEMCSCGRRIVEITQRDPAGHEMHLGPVGLARRRRGLAHHSIGRLILLLIEQLSGENASLAPPLIRLLQHHVIRARGRASSSPAQARSDWSGPRRYERNVQYAWPVRIFIDERGVAAEAWGA